MRKILITGAAGFLGQLSIDYFKKRYKLYLIDKIFLKQIILLKLILLITIKLIKF